MSTMYEKYLTWRKYSLQELQDSSGYDSELDKACFDVQQALEFLMKAILLDRNVKYDKTHDILYLWELMEEAGFDFGEKDELIVLASTITSWEEKGRYFDGIKTKKNTVNRVYRIMDSMDEAFLREQEENNMGQKSRIDHGGGG